MLGRDDLHTMLDAIPEGRLAAARDALAALADPMMVALLNAPIDDEPLTDEDRAAIAEARAEQERGELATLDEYLAGRRSPA